MTSTSTFVVQIASVPGHQAGQRAFQQSRYLHELLVSALTNADEDISNKKQINALTKLLPEHEVVLRSGFSQTSRWGLEPNMFIEVHGDEKQARMISALFGEAFCQDGIGIGMGSSCVDGQSHSVLTVNAQWKDEEERLKLASNILQQYPTLSAQLDIDGQLTFHDYSLCAPDSFAEIISRVRECNATYSVEEKRVHSELVDRSEYESILTLLESANARRALNVLRHAHARLFSGYACGSLTLPSLSKRRRHKRREQRTDQLDRYRHPLSPSHLCSVIFTSRRPCMCLTDDNCFCHYTLVFTAHLPSPISR